MTVPGIELNPHHPEVEGTASGGDVSVIVIDTAEGGAGPRLHRHPYPETFVLVEGEVRFWVGDEDFIAKTHSVQVAPPMSPHRFEVTGASHTHMVAIHASPRFVTEWLEEGDSPTA
jgi:mannose-6-phosphate isomerase-like protein (cupin superfamily)